MATTTTATGEEAAVAPKQPAETDTSQSMAIGPSVEQIQPVQPSDKVVCNITLLLTTGARHPYRIDERYLAKRNVNVPGKTPDGRSDPFTISVYTLKELILREWREEWESKPASPSSIRLIHFGKLLDDKEPLKGNFFFLPPPLASTSSPFSLHIILRLVIPSPRVAFLFQRGRASGPAVCVPIDQEIDR